MTKTYEEILGTIQAASRASSNDDRDISWLGSSVGIAKNPTGLLEIFLKGPPLVGRYRRVASAIEYQRWYRAGGRELSASRLLLPAAGHFEHVAAFVCTELLRNGADVDIEGAFAKSEPVIDLAITDLLVAEEALVGLFGELTVLQALLLAAEPAAAPLILEGWQGFKETSRDFQFGFLGAEVKATTGESSSHLFSGVHQMELGHGVDGADERAFRIVSIGLDLAEEADGPTAQALPELVDRMLATVRRRSGISEGNISDFLGRLAQYGQAHLGYDHVSMSGSSRYSKRFRVKFARAYDVSDRLVRLFTTEDLRARPFVDGGSMRLRVNFPDQVDGDNNPVAGLGAVAQHLLSISGLPDADPLGPS